MSKKERIVCGLDIGSSKLCMVVARIRPEGGLEVLSTGFSPSAGIRKGVILEMEEAAAAIRKAREEVELRSGVSVDWVTVGMSGDHIEGINCHGAIPIEGSGRSVRSQDVAQVIQAAQSIPLQPKREIIHVLTQEFLLDSRGGIRNPVGLSGQRLDVNIYVVTCDSALLQTLIHTVNRAEMRVQKVALQQLASAESVLTKDERELGAAVIDIGGGTTGISIFAKNAVRYTSFLPVGGENFTRDLAIGLRTPLEEAEKLKKEKGSVLVDQIASDETVEAPAVGTAEVRQHQRRTACQFLRDRAVELMEMTRSRIEEAGETAHILRGAVLTGGGSALDGMVELAEEILEMPVRPGGPHGLEVMSEDLSHPACAAVVGLAKFASMQGQERNTPFSQSGSSPWFIQRFLSWVGS